MAWRWRDKVVKKYRLLNFGERRPIRCGISRNMPAFDVGNCEYRIIEGDSPNDYEVGIGEVSKDAEER